MHRDFNSDQIRHLLLLVNKFDRKYGAENCYFELFDAMHQLGVSVRFPELCMRGGKWRHAERFVIDDENGASEAMKRLAEWEKAEIARLDERDAAEDAERRALIEKIKKGELT